MKPSIALGLSISIAFASACGSDGAAGAPATLAEACSDDGSHDQVIGTYVYLGEQIYESVSMYLPNCRVCYDSPRYVASGEFSSHLTWTSTYGGDGEILMTWHGDSHPDSDPDEILDVEADNVFGPSDSRLRARRPAGGGYSCDGQTP